MHPTTPLYFKFSGGRVPKINRFWVEELMLTANTPRGLQVLPEPPDAESEAGEAKLCREFIFCTTLKATIEEIIETGRPSWIKVNQGEGAPRPAELLVGPTTAIALVAIPLEE